MIGGFSVALNTRVGASKVVAQKMKRDVFTTVERMSGLKNWRTNDGQMNLRPAGMDSLLFGRFPEVSRKRPKEWILNGLREKRVDY